MSAYMNRSAAEHWGLNWPKDIAVMEPSCHGESRYVTWAEVLDRRRKWQAERLAEIRIVPEPRVQPCYVWVFYNPIWIYMGWWCYVVTRRGQVAVNFQTFHTQLAMSLMAEIPVGVFPDRNNFRLWMEAVADRYPRRTTHHRQAGTVVGWMRDKRIFTRLKP